MKISLLDCLSGRYGTGLMLINSQGKKTDVPLNSTGLVPAICTKLAV